MGRLLAGLRRYLGQKEKKADKPQTAISEEERQRKLARIGQCKQLGEDEYDQLYEPRTHANPAGHYSDAKDFFREAISLAAGLGLTEEAEALTARLAHIQAVFRSQFAGFDSAPAVPAHDAGRDQAEDASAEAEPTAEEAIRKNASMVVEMCRQLTDFDFGYSAQSVECVAGYLERIRSNESSAIDRNRLIDVFGSYLGEAIIASFGGKWEQDDLGWHVAFDERNKAYPFAKVEKQMRNGLADSVFAFYSLIPTLFPRRG